MTSPAPEIDPLSNHLYKELCRKEILIVLHDWMREPVLADWNLINSKLLEARQSGDVTREEYLDAIRSDIIARRAGDCAHAGPLAVVEASITFSQNDLENAARRAAIIASVTGNSVSAFVVTHEDWPDEVNIEAEALGVTVIRHEDPYHEGPF